MTTTPFASILDEAPGATSRDWNVDAAITVALAILTVSPYLFFALTSSQMFLGFRYGDPILVFIAAVAFIGPLGFRRHHPMLMAILVGLAGLLQIAVSATPMLTAIAVPLVAYSVARWVDGDEARFVIWIGLVGSFLGPWRWLISGGSLNSGTLVSFLLTAVVCIGAVVTPYAIGRRLRESDLVEQEQEQRVAERRSAELQSADQRARFAEVNARNQIARELHDIVAHSLSVMIVQAEGGKALAAKKPDAAAPVLDTIAETGRDALVEMRRIVSVLRQDPRAQLGAEFGPAPTLADIPDLVAKSGDRVRLEVTGTPPVVSPTLALNAYRIVQEALTNFL